MHMGVRACARAAASWAIARAMFNFDILGIDAGKSRHTQEKEYQNVSEIYKKKENKKQDRTGTTRAMQLQLQLISWKAMEPRWEHVSVCSLHQKQVN